MKNFIIYLVLWLYLQLIVLTCRWKTHNINILENALLENKALMLSTWHERLVFLACFFKHWDPSVWVISSQHKDSEILAKILNSWGFRFIKGSSSRGWYGAIKNLSHVFKAPGSIVAVTHDGPKGPRLKAKEGSLKIALKNNITVIGMSGISSRFWTLNTWDKIKIPKPFSTIHVVFYKKYPGENSIEVFNQYLNTNQEKTDRLAGVID